MLEMNIITIMMLPEESTSSGIASQLHLSQLLPGPVGVQVGGADEGQVDTQGSEKWVGLWSS